MKLPNSERIDNNSHPNGEVERSMNNTAITQQTELMQNQDLNDALATQVDVLTMQPIYHATTVESVDLDSFLSRAYVIDNLLWTTSDLPGKVLKTYAFPYDLINAAPQLGEKLKDFKFFRAGIRITLRVNATKFLYGSVLASWEPNADINDMREIGTQINIASGYPHVIVSASTADSISFDIPFVYQKMAWDLTTALPRNILGEFDAIVLAQLTSIMGDPGSANILVTAQFIDPEVWFPVSNTLSWQDPPSAKYGQQESEISLKKKRRSRKTPISEMMDKSEKGVISRILDATVPIASSLTTVPFIAPFASAFKGVGTAIRPVLDMFGLDKPVDISSSTVACIDPYRHMAYGFGNDPITVYGLDPEQGISTIPNVGGISHDEMLITTIVKTPSISDIVQITDNSSIDVQLVHKPSASFRGGQVFTICDYVSTLFALQSGSLKVKLYFFASQFHNVRLRVSWQVSSKKDTNIQYSRIVDIAGDTTTDFVLPWMRAEAMYSYMDFGTLNLEVLSWSTPDTTIATPITMVMYKSFNDDYVCAQPRFLAGAITNQQECDPRMDFSSEFEPIHPSCKSMRVENLNTGENIQTMRDLLHCYLPYGVWTTNLELYANGAWRNPLPNIYRGECNVHTFVSALFSFWRGSTRWKVIPSKDMHKRSSIRALATHNALAFSNVGMSLPVEMLKPYIDAHIPWANTNFYESTTQKCQVGAFVTYDPTPHAYAMNCFGDDVSFHFIRGPPPVMFTSMATYNGVHYDCSGDFMAAAFVDPPNPNNTD